MSVLWPIEGGTDRDPCPRCGVRGDLGCSHRQPTGAAAPVPSEPKDERRRKDSAGNGWNFHRRTLSRSARLIEAARKLESGW